MFGLNIEVDYRKDYQDIDLGIPSDSVIGGAHLWGYSNAIK